MVYDDDNGSSCHCIEVLLELEYKMNVCDYYTVAEHVDDSKYDDYQAGVFASCLFNVPQSIIEEINSRTKNLFDLVLDSESYKWLASQLLSVGFELSANNVGRVFAKSEEDACQYLDRIRFLFYNAFDCGAINLSGVSGIIGNLFDHFKEYLDDIGIVHKFDYYDIEVRSVVSDLVAGLFRHGYEPVFTDLLSALSVPALGIHLFYTLFQRLDGGMRANVGGYVPDLLICVLDCFSVAEDDHLLGFYTDGYEEHEGTLFLFFRRRVGRL